MSGQEVTLINPGLIPGTLAQMAADALLLTPSNEGKRWQATDDGDRIYSYRFSGGAWDYYPESGTDSSGNINVNATGAVGTLETRTFTIGADTDCFTDKAAPLVAEIITADTFVAGKKRCRVSVQFDEGVPFASTIVATLNAGDDVTAVSRLTYVDVSAGGTGSIDTRQRTLSKTNPVIEWDLSQTASQVTRLDLGGYLDGGTGAAVVYISVEVW